MLGGVSSSCYFVRSTARSAVALFTSTVRSFGSVSGCGICPLRASRKRVCLFCDDGPFAGRMKPELVLSDVKGPVNVEVSAECPASTISSP